MLQASNTAARGLGLQLTYVETRTVDGIDKAVSEMVRARAGAVVVLGSVLLFNERKRLAELALKHRLPSMFQNSTYVEAGGLMSYGPDFEDLFRRAASYVDRILKGTRPGDLPVEQPTKFELVVNTRTAKALGVTIPPAVIQRADQLIE